MSEIRQVDFEVVCASNRPELLADLRKALTPVGVRHLNGENATSFSELVNGAFESSFADVVVFANDKARPKPDDIFDMCQLLNQGFALVAFYRLGFFAMRKSVFEALGGMDLRFVDGGFEDNDLYLRLKFNNLAVYVAERINYLTTVPTSWSQTSSRAAFHEKYAFNLGAKLIRVDFQEMRAPGLTPEIKALHKPWSESYLEAIPLETRKAKFDQVINYSDFFDAGDGKTPTLWHLIARVFLKSPYLLVPCLLSRRHYRSQVSGSRKRSYLLRK